MKFSLKGKAQILH